MWRGLLSLLNLGVKRIIFKNTTQPYFTLQLPERPIRIGENIMCLFGKENIQIFDKETKRILCSYRGRGG